MRKIKCEFLGEVFTIKKNKSAEMSCEACFEMQKSEDEYIESLHSRYYQTRAECVQHHGEYFGEYFLDVEEEYEMSPTEELVVSMAEVDEDASFELDGVYWVSLKGMSQYVDAIKKFEKDLKREGYEIIPQEEVEELELEGIWYRRIKKGE